MTLWNDAARPLLLSPIVGSNYAMAASADPSRAIALPAQGRVTLPFGGGAHGSVNPWSWTVFTGGSAPNYPLETTWAWANDTQNRRTLDVMTLFQGLGGGMFLKAADAQGRPVYVRAPITETPGSKGIPKGVYVDKAQGLTWDNTDSFQVNTLEPYLTGSLPPPGFVLQR